jgi:hypothetical protein
MRRSLTALFLALLASGAAVPCQDVLLPRLNRFADEYNLFARQVNRGRFDVAQAKRLSRLWAEIERSGYWPER